MYKDRGGQSCLNGKHLTSQISPFPPGPFHQLPHCARAETYRMIGHPESKQSDKDSTFWPEYHFSTGQAGKGEESMSTQVQTETMHANI